MVCQISLFYSIPSIPQSIPYSVEFARLSKESKSLNEPLVEGFIG